MSLDDFKQSAIDCINNITGEPGGGGGGTGGGGTGGGGDTIQIPEDGEVERKGADARRGFYGGSAGMAILIFLSYLGIIVTPFGAFYEHKDKAKYKHLTLTKYIMSALGGKTDITDDYISISNPAAYEAVGMVVLIFVIMALCVVIAIQGFQAFSNDFMYFKEAHEHNTDYFREDCEAGQQESRNMALYLAVFLVVIIIVFIFCIYVYADHPSESAAFPYRALFPIVNGYVGLVIVALLLVYVNVFIYNGVIYDYQCDKYIKPRPVEPFKNNFSFLR